jgi:hypothetical protein
LHPGGNLQTCIHPVPVQRAKQWDTHLTAVGVPGQHQIGTVRDRLERQFRLVDHDERTLPGSTIA